MDTDDVANPRPLAKGTKFHTFLSHSWLTGQDQMRITKQRLLELLPTLSIFLDVDIEDMVISDLEGYIDASQTCAVAPARPRPLPPAPLHAPCVVHALWCMPVGAWPLPPRCSRHPPS